MTDQRGESAVLWREGNHRCELWIVEGDAELRVYVSDALTYREMVQPTTSGLRQAAALRAAAQAENERSVIQPTLDGEQRANQPRVQRTETPRA